MMRDLALGWRLLHGFIIVLLLIQVLYCNLQIWFFVRPEGHVGPMFGTATQIPIEMMVTRRLYAIEAWMAFVGLALYLALTELLPRMLRAARS